MSLSNENLDELQHGFFVPSKPDILDQINSLPASDDRSLTELAEMISHDIGLSSSILKVINSIDHGMNRTISDIKQAVCFLGLEDVKTIIAASKIRDAFQGQCSIKLERFWDEALDTASIMLYINSKTGNRVPADFLYTFGLFHDCGIPAMACKYEDYRQVLVKANQDNLIELTDIEEEHYGTNHATIGYFIASSWHLPKNLCQLILCHHEEAYMDTDAGELNKMCYALLQIGENLINDTRHFETSVRFDKNKENYFEILGMTEVDFQDMKDDLYDALSGAR